LNIPISIGVAPTQTTTATVNITGGTATNNVDYVVATPLVTFNSTTTTGNIVIHVYNDDYVEGNETITLGYTLNANGGNAQAGTLNQTVTVTINDDDVAPSGVTVPTTVFTQNFNTGLAPFTTVNPSGNTAWQVGLAAAASTNAYTVPTTNATQFAWINDDACNCTQANVDLKSAVFSLAGYTGASLTFDAFFLGNTYQNVTETANVKISTNGGTTFTNLFTIPGNTAWAPYTVDLTPYIGNANLMLAFNYGDGGGWLYGCSIDNVVVTGQAAAGIQTAVNTAAPDQAYLGPNGTVYFADPTSSKIMMKIQNNSSFDYGCVDVMVDRQGTTPTTAAFTTNNTADYLMSKTFKVVPTNNSATGNYTITLYYKENEVAAWETATGNSRNNIEMIKVSGNTSSIAAVTPANFGTFTIADMPATIGAFGTDVTFTSTYTTGFSGFGMGIMNTVPGAPTASFTSPTSACVNTAVSFTNTSTGTPTSYLWNFGDGQTSTQANPTHTYATSGSFTVTLTVTNAVGNNTTTSGIVVQATVTYYADVDGDGFGNPNASVSDCSQPVGYILNNSDCADNSASVYPNATELCNNNVDDNCNGLIDDGNGVAYQQNIILCDGEFVVVGSNTYTAPGFYTDVLVSANGCDSTVTTLLEVIPYPIVTLTSSADTLCSNFLDVAQLTGTPAGGVFGTPASSTGLVNSASIGDGVYDIPYTYDMNGCSTTEMVTVVVQICGGVEENSLSMVVAYPSPANENISFKGLELGAPIQLFDAAGKLVYSSKVNREVVTLNVKNYAEGIYTLKSEKEGKAGSISFLVKH
jgi:PKD repeat protein